MGSTSNSKIGYIYFLCDSYNNVSCIFWKYTDVYSTEYKQKLKLDTCKKMSVHHNLKNAPSLTTLFIIEKFNYQDKALIDSRVIQWRNKMFKKQCNMEHKLPEIPQYLVEIANDYRNNRDETQQKTIPITNIYNELPKNPLISNVSKDKPKTNNRKQDDNKSNKAEPIKAYIYSIFSPQENKYYIGSTTEDVKRRCEKHKCIPVPKMKHLKDTFDKLEIKIIEEDVYDNLDELALKEDYYMVLYDCVDNGYNSRYNKCHSTCTTKLQEYKRKLQRKHGLKFDGDEDNDDIDYKELYKQLSEKHNKLKDKYDKLLINYNKNA